MQRQELVVFMAFTTLSLSSPLLQALRDEGYSTPTPIQAQAIPPLMEGLDLLGCAQTGTGKTAAFALPILHRLLAQRPDPARRGPALPRALILAPTRELATQIGDSFATYGRHTGLRHACIYGGVSQFHQERALRNGVDILIATPGRLMDLMEQRITNFSAISIFVLDEADRMLDMGFIQPIRRIAAALPSARQTMLFSATMPGPIRSLAQSLLKNPVTITVAAVSSAAPKIKQSLFYVPRTRKQALLQHLLDESGVERAVVFTKTKHGADRVMKKLVQSGVSAQAIHGNKAQNQRQRALDAFKTGRSRVLVATDVAARGLDVDGITHVINFDLPMEPEAYVHRIGRTGRAGAEGIAISFCDPEERGLLRDIERLLGNKVPSAGPLPELPEPVFTDTRPLVHPGAHTGGRMVNELPPARPAPHNPGAFPSRGSPDRRPNQGPRTPRPAHHPKNAQPQGHSSGGGHAHPPQAPRHADRPRRADHAGRGPGGTSRGGQHHTDRSGGKPRGGRGGW
jgi:ATP-dependent RNA helicase RhlE